MVAGANHVRTCWPLPSTRISSREQKNARYVSVVTIAFLFALLRRVFVWLSGCLAVWLSGCLGGQLAGCVLVGLFVWPFGCVVVWLFICLNV